MGSWKGRFNPINRHKYMGDPDNIRYMSSMELKCYRFLDTNPSILKYAVEEFTIQYISPKDNRIHKYFPDVLVRKINPDGKEETILCEIKPKSQSIPPVRGKTAKSDRRYKKDCLTYAINMAKWDAAQAYCKQKGWKWAILTEKDLGVVYTKGKMKKMVKRG